MKLKNKLLVVLLIAIAMLLIVPSMASAATEYTYSDTEQGIEWKYELDSNNNVINLRCTTTGKTGTVVIPSTIDGKTVISLKQGYTGKGAFSNCAGITAITMPDTLMLIGDYSFENCTGLKTVTMPSSVTKIGNSAFKGCSGLTSVNLSQNLTIIENYAFNNCTGLKTITIPNSVTTIELAAFMDCSGLRQLTLSENLTKISDRTFEGCTGLTSVIIPENVTTIEGSYSNIYGAFGDCTNLQKILIPDNVASIGVGAFQGCNKLTIYGHDEQVSKEYAEANEISFDYIENWDKEESGQDITAPVLEKIQVTYASVMNYNKDTNTNMYIVPAEAKLVINAYFNETIKGTTVPTLTIKFGDGQNIEVTGGTVAGNKITYIYTVASADKGTMSTVKFEGGNITDEAGNAATLSCPALSIEHDSFNKDLIYANGTATNPGGNQGTGNEGTGNEGTGNEGTGNEGTGNEGTGNEGTGNEGTGNQGTGSQGTGNGNQPDGTQAPGKLPNTGKTTVLTIFAVLALVGIVFYIKVRKYRDVK